MNATVPYWWSVDISSGNGMVPSVNETFSELMLTKFYVAIYRLRTPTLGFTGPQVCWQHTHLLYTDHKIVHIFIHKFVAKWCFISSSYKLQFHHIVPFPLVNYALPGDHTKQMNHDWIWALWRLKPCWISGGILCLNIGWSALEYAVLCNMVIYRYATAFCIWSWGMCL